MSNPKFEDTEEIQLESTPSFDDTEDTVELPNINQPGITDDIAAAGRQFVRSFPGANNLKALYNAANSDMSYSEALGKEIEAENIDSKSFPVASAAGQIGSFAIPGLGVTKALNVGSKALKLGKAATMTAGALGNVVFDTAFMAAKKIGDESDISSENIKEEGSKALKSAVTGQALGLAAGTGLGLATKFGASAINKVGNFVLNETNVINNSLKGASKSIKDAAKKIDIALGEGTFESVFKKLNVNPDDIATDPSLLKEAAKKAISATGEQIGDVYRNLDAISQGAKLYSGSKLASSIKEIMLDYNAKNEIPQNVKDAITAKYDDLFFQVDPQTNLKIAKAFSPKDLWDLRTKFNAEDYPLFKEITDTKIRNRIGAAFTENVKDAAAMYTAQADAFMSQFSKKGAEGVSEIPDAVKQIKDSLSQLPELNKTYAALSETNRKVFNKFILPNDSVNQGSMVLQEALKVKMSDLKIAGLAGLASSSGPAGVVALGSLAGIRATRQYLSEMANFTNKQPLANKFLGWEQAFGRAEDLLNDPHVSGILSRLSQKISADEPLNSHELDLAKSKINLYLKPLPRTSSAIKQRLDDIIPLAEEIGGKEYIQKLNQAVEMDDGTLPELLDSISKTPELMRYFEAGQGFDGKLYGQDREIAARSIANDYKIPSVTRKNLADEMMQTGVVPDINQFKRPEPKPLIARDKNKVR